MVSRRVSLASVLERDLHWQRDSYNLQIENGVATITLFKEDPVREEEANRQLLEIDGLQTMTIAVQPVRVDNQTKPDVFMGITSWGRGEAFPTRDLFQPLIANPKSNRSSLSVSTVSNPRD